MADVAELDAATPDAVPAEEPAGDAPRRWLDPALAIGLFAFTIVTRLPRLDRPNAFVFDEIYYVPDSADILRSGVERGGVVHPPVGKWLIALGIRADGMTPIGWRLSALVCGGLVVVLTYVAARQLVANRWLAAAAGLLVALDGVAYTTGRVGMLDVFVALFTMIVVCCTLAALRRWQEPRAVARYRWGAAVAAGFGIGVKWTVGYVLVVAVIGFVVVEARQSDRSRQGWRFTRTILTLGLVPVAVYLACYVPWMVRIDKTYAGIQACEHDHECSYSVLDRLRLFKDDQQRILKFHNGLTSKDNSNADLAYLWADQASPSVLYRKTCIPQLEQAPAALNDGACTGAASGDVAEIATVANPVVWFAGLAAGLGVAWLAWRRRSAALLLVLLFFLYQWFPWVIDPFGLKDAVLKHDVTELVQQRRAYSFYLSSMVPIVALWPAIALDGKRRRWAAVPLAIAAVAAFAFYVPIWQGRPMRPDQIHAREWWTIFQS